MENGITEKTDNVRKYRTVEEFRYSRTQFPHGPGPSAHVAAAFAAYDAIKRIEDGKNVDNLADILVILAHDFEPTPANEAFVAVLTAAVKAAQAK